MSSTPSTPTSLTSLLDAAISAREPMFDAKLEGALRLFNGFTEGCPDLAIDLYARTLLIANYADPVARGAELVEEALACALRRLPWVQAAVLKVRNSADQTHRQGLLIHGTAPDRKVREHGAWYSIDLTMNRDASLYLDTRNVRAWAIETLAGKSVLNTFAYTGSFGVAAMKGGAARVVQQDLNREFLNVGKTSYTLNGFPIKRPEFQSGDFWLQTNQLKRSGDLFDCVFVDPPFFSKTDRGTVEIEKNYLTLINKVRPLINDGGWLVAINNALYLSGADYMAGLESLCSDGYLSIERTLPVTEDFTGFVNTQVAPWPVDPAPFNHPTKVVILRVKRKAAVTRREITLGGPRP